MAAAGGIGVIHRNLEPGDQAEEVRKVKRFESGMVVDPITIFPDATLNDALEPHAPRLDLRHSGGRARDDGKPAGSRHPHQPRRALRRRSAPTGDRTYDGKVVTVREGVSHDEARRLLHQHRIEKLVVIDEA